MTSVFATVIEGIVVAFTVWGLFNEDKFIAFEDRMKEKLRRRSLKVIKGGKSAEHCA